MCNVFLVKDAKNRNRITTNGNNKAAVLPSIVAQRYVYNWWFTWLSVICLTIENNENNSTIIMTSKRSNKRNQATICTHTEARARPLTRHQGVNWKMITLWHRLNAFDNRHFCLLNEPKKYTHKLRSQIIILEQKQYHHIHCCMWAWFFFSSFCHSFGLKV